MDSTFENYNAWKNTQEALEERKKIFEYFFKDNSETPNKTIVEMHILGYLFSYNLTGELKRQQIYQMVYEEFDYITKMA